MLASWPNSSTFGSVAFPLTGSQATCLAADNVSRLAPLCHHGNPFQLEYPRALSWGLPFFLVYTIDLPTSMYTRTPNAASSPMTRHSSRRITPASLQRAVVAACRTMIEGLASPRQHHENRRPFLPTQHTVHITLHSTRLQ